MQVRAMYATETISLHKAKTNQIGQTGWRMMSVATAIKFGQHE